MDYDLELDRVVGLIKSHKAGCVAIQLPDGLKREAKRIADFITKSTNARVLIWGGSCYGACDIPRGLEDFGVELLIQFGHAQNDWTDKTE